MNESTYWWVGGWVGGTYLVLLVLGNKVVEVGLRLGELQLLHAFPCIPVQEGLAGKHETELVGNALPDLLDGRVVAHESRRHFQSGGGHVADGGLDVVGDPLDKVAGVLGDDLWVGGWVG